MWVRGDEWQAVPSSCMEPGIWTLYGEGSQQTISTPTVSMKVSKVPETELCGKRDERVSQQDGREWFQRLCSLNLELPSEFASCKRCKGGKPLFEERRREEHSKLS